MHFSQWVEDGSDCEGFTFLRLTRAAHPASTDRPHATQQYEINPTFNESPSVTKTLIYFSALLIYQENR